MDVKFQQVLNHNQSLEQKVLKMESKFRKVSSTISYHFIHVYVGERQQYKVLDYMYSFNPLRLF
jgi:hypothetical protein